MKHIPTPIQHNTKQDGTGAQDTSGESVVVWVYLPVRITMWLQPHNLLLRTDEELIKLPFSSQQLQAIDIYVTQLHSTLNTAMTDYLKQAIRRHEKCQEIIKRVRQWFGEDADVKIDVELLGEILWNEVQLNGS